MVFLNIYSDMQQESSGLPHYRLCMTLVIITLIFHQEIKEYLWYNKQCTKCQLDLILSQMSGYTCHCHNFVHEVLSRQRLM